jgi:hypothetical protein
MVTIYNAYFNIKKHYILLTLCIYVFHHDCRINCDDFPSRANWFEMEIWCVLCEVGTELLKYYFDQFPGLKGLKEWVCTDKRYGEKK